MNKFAKFYLEKLGAEINSIMKPLSGGGVAVNGLAGDPAYGNLVAPRPSGTSTIQLHGGGKGTPENNYDLWLNRSESPVNPSRRSETSGTVDNDNKWQNMTSGKNLEAFRPALKDTDRVVATSCNHDGGGCPKFYENLAGHPLKEVIMTPPGSYGRSDAVSSPYKWPFDSWLTGLRSKEIDTISKDVSPLRRYVKNDKEEWEDRGIYADGRKFTSNDLYSTYLGGLGGLATGFPAAYRIGLAAEAAGKSTGPILKAVSGPLAKGMLSKASLINFGIQAAGEARETISQGGVGNHLRNMDSINNDPDYTYEDKINSNIARPIGSILSVGAKTPGVASYLSGFDEPDPDPTPWNRKKILQGSNFKSLTGGKPGYGINRNTVIPPSTQQSVSSFGKTPLQSNIGSTQPTKDGPEDLGEMTFNMNK